MAKRSNNSMGRRAYGGKPYDANNSFVKKMATKVTDLIPQRSWISKWFNASQDTVDKINAVDGEDELQQPPVKRPRIRMDVTHPPGTFSITARDKNKANNHDSQMNNETEEYFLEPAVAGPSGSCKFVSSTPAVPNGPRNENSQRAATFSSQLSTGNNCASNGADDNSESGESTSGCSSLIPQTSRQECVPNSTYGSNLPTERRFMDDKSFANHLQSPRSLFLESGASRNSISNRRPSFNASIMNTDGNNLERSASLSSPFYSGNVTFGGANAVGNFKRGRSLFNSMNEYQLKIPRRTSVQVKPSNVESIDSSGMSQTAKRILEAMEYFSSPISDAKKIPVKKQMETSMGKKRSREEIGADSSIRTARVGLRHLTRELAVPTVPEMLKLRRRQKLQDTTLAARKIVSAMSGPAPSSTLSSMETEIVSTSPSVVSEDYHLRTELDQSPKYQAKLRGKSKKNPEHEAPTPMVNLPSISLPITSLPSFEPLPKYSVSTISTASKDAKVSEKNRTDFKFASPIKITEASWNLKSINNFSFSKPINASESMQSQSNHSSISASLVTDPKNTSGGKNCNDGVATNFIWSGSSTAPRLKVKTKQKDAESPDGEKNKIFDRSTMKEMAKLKSGGTGMESGSLRPTMNDRSSNNIELWECSECYIKNDAKENICVACKAPKLRATGNEETKKLSNAIVSESGATVRSITDTSVDRGFGSQFKMNADQWECEACLVRNTMTNSKCVSCSSPKPSVNRAGDSLTSSSMKNDLAEKFKPAEGSWECPGCMLRNASTVITCPCCSASKPNMTKGSPKKGNFREEGVSATDSSKKFGTREKDGENSKLMDKFKPASNTWECSSCMVRNNETASTCVCCSNPKPGTTAKEPASAPRFNVESGWGDKFKKPEGSWSCDSCMLQNKAEANECVACNATKPGGIKKAQTPTSQFSFGVPAGNQSFKFGTDKAEEKPKWASSGDVTNGFEFPTKSAQSNVPSGQFTFGVPKESQKKVEASGKSSTSSSGGFVFASPKTAKDNAPKFETNKSNEAAKDSGDKSAGDEKNNAMTFLFGMPKTMKPESVPEDSSKLEPDQAAKNTPVKSQFVFGVPKSEENQSNDRKLKFDPPASGKPSIFGNQTSTTTSNESNVLGAIKSNDDQRGKSSNTNVVSDVTATSPFSDAKSKMTASTIPSIVPNFRQPSELQSSSTFSMTGTTSNQETNLSQTENKPVASNFGIPNSAAAPTAFGILPSSGSSAVQAATPAIDTKNCFAPAEKPKSTFFDISGEKKPPAFGTPLEKNGFGQMFGKPDEKLTSAFGSSDKPVASNPMFTSGTSSPSSLPPAPTFTGSSTVASQPVFGASTATVFGSNTAAPTFGSTSNVGTTNIFAPAEKSNVAPVPASNPGLFSFGAASTQQVSNQSTPGRFFFPTDNTDSSAIAAKPMFRFGNTSATNSQPNPTDCFGTSNTNTGAFGAPATAVSNPSTSPFTFNAPSTKQDPPAFGQTSATIPNIFGAQPISGGIGQQAQGAPSTFPTNAAPASTGFNFGAPAPSNNSSGFNFGAAMTQPAATASGGFNFNAPSSSPAVAFDPNTRPSFNFTGGTAPTAFNATPQPVAARKIKKAVRRIQQR